VGLQKAEMFDLPLNPSQGLDHEMMMRQLLLRLLFKF